ncbi:hypothetical protein C8R43DRAFT_621731 [Mycena crocata]|nr:hypothetical protein C8R43DRAFT_621731 [Mycena crocata]
MVSLLRVHGWTILFNGILAALAVPGIVSSSWRKPNVTLGSPERVHLASAALQQSVSLVATLTEFRATVYFEMAEFDIATQGNTYATDLQQNLPDATRSQEESEEIDLGNLLSVGHAAIRAYTAYNNPTFLDLANRTWTYALSHTITAQNVASGSQTGKEFPVATTCQGATMLGGTFDTNNATDPSITGFASTYFFALSALLAEATSSSIYLNAALDSLDFITTQLSTQNLVHTSISASQDDAPCALDSTPSSFNTGILINGLAILSSITNNASTKALLENVIISTTSNPEWQTAEGIIARGGDKVGDKYIVRGLAAAYTKNVTTPELRTYVHDYLAVQFNAVIDLATSNANNIYAGCWTGPPSASFSQSNQTTAIGALLSAINLDDAEPTSTVPGTIPSSSSSPFLSATAQRHSSRVSVIIGAVVGPVVLIAIGVCGWFLLRRRARAAQPMSPLTTMTVSTSPTSPPISASLTRAYSPAGYGLKSAGSAPISPLAMPRRAPSEHLHTPTNDAASSSFGSASEPPRSLPATSVQLPITELVRQLTLRLNERLSTRQWDEEQPPPEYGTSEG